MSQPNTQNNPWLTLKEGECFFVPCLDEISDGKNWRAMGYVGGKMPPLTKIGVYKGMFGILCFRHADKRLTHRVASAKRTATSAHATDQVPPS